MSYELFIGDRSFSSWSMRGWLMFEKFGLPVRTQLVGLYSGTMKQDLAALTPARFVPVMRDSDGIVLGDSLAMAETLAERHPDAGLWPDDPAARALARWLVAEMHSGYTALRNDCPMQLLCQHRGFVAADGVLADLDRIQHLWALARDRHGTREPWLFGAYSLADVFFAPVAMRIAGYGLPVSPAARTYVDSHLTDDAVRRWRAMGLTKTYDPVPYTMDLPRDPWPGPATMPAHRTQDTNAENETCPYSGKPVTHFLELNGRVFGFCNAFCRDKTVADPAAWPEFMNIYQS